MSKMSHFRTLAATLLLLPAVTSAQSYYFRAGGGYAMPFMTQTVGGDGGPISGGITLPSSGNGNNVTYNIDKVSLNTGAIVTAAAGCMFGDHVGIEISYSQTVAAKKHSLIVSNYTDKNSIPYDLTITTQARNPVVLSPSLVLQSGGKRLNAYARFGLTVPVSLPYEQSRHYTNLPGYGKVSTTVATYQYNSSFSLGMAAAGGLSYKIGATRLWAEANMLSQPFNTEQAKLTSFMRDGIEYISQIAGSTTITYSNNFTSAASSTTENVSRTVPFSNIGICLGVSFSVEGNHKMLKDLRAQKKKERNNH